MDNLKDWIDKVNSEEHKHPNKTFGNKPYFPNHVQSTFIKEELKKLDTIEKELLETLAIIRTTKDKLIKLGGKGIISGKIF